jgi:hypothetical protein
MRKYPIKHAVSFHSSIQRAEIFKDHNEAYNQSFKKHGTIETFHVSGKTPTGTRARIVNEFAATDRGLITNARCLTEGVDVPDIDCVMFADPRRSAVDIVQAVGRALRPAKGKKMGYVIVPILHDAKAKPDDIFDSEEFQEILTTLRALAANDERIVEYFRSIASGKKRSRSGLVVFDIDEKNAKRIDLEQFTRNIELRCWDRLARLSWRPFNEAREFVRGLRLRNFADWMDFYRGKYPEKGTLPADIPTNPNVIYSLNGWAGWGDWLGTGTIATAQRRYLPCRTARAFVRNLRLKSGAEWLVFCKGDSVGKGKLPADIPASPQMVYAGKGWAGMGDWLGTGNVAPRLRKYRSFKKARAFARGLGLKTGKEWRLFSKGLLPHKGKLPTDIPAAPQITYSNRGWAGVGDWLGTGAVAAQLRKYRSFKKARSFARGLRLKNGAEWRAFCNGSLSKLGHLPDDIPRKPNDVYADNGWISMGDWLGSGFTAFALREYLPFTKGRAFARSLGLRSRSEWNAFCKGALPEKGSLPANIPAKPDNTYAGKGWTGVSDWLGIDQRKAKRHR